MGVQELETAVRQLSRPELSEFARWFEEYLADEWDRQMEADAAAGKFDSLAEEALREYESGRCKPL